MIRSLKLFVTALAIFSAIFGSAMVANPLQLFRIDINSLDTISIEEQKSKHVVSYGVDPLKVEDYYKTFQIFFNAKNINATVYVYACKPQFPKGQIGKDPLTGVLYYGAFKTNVPDGKDIIVYNGDDTILIHEMVHFFFRHMNRYDQSEMLAQLTVKYFGLSIELVTIARLTEKLKVLSENLKTGALSSNGSVN